MNQINYSEQKKTEMKTEKGPEVPDNKTQINTSISESAKNGF